MVNKQKQEKKEKEQKDKDWREIILNKYNAKCVICDDTKRPNAHHIIPKNFIKTRWDVKNGILLCPKHHKFGSFSAHKHPLWFLEFLSQKDLPKFHYLLNQLEEETCEGVKAK